MDYMYKIRDMLCTELEEIAKKPDLTSANLEVVDKLTHSIKSIDTIKAMEEAGYDDGNSYRYDGGNSYRGGSYARGRGRNARRDSMGRYSREDGGYSRDGRSYRNDGYSREDGKEEFAENLRGMMEDAPDEKTRMEIKRLIDKMNA